MKQTNYDNWNGGIYYYTLTLTINVDVFSQIRTDILQYETTIYEAISQAYMPDESEVITTVKLLPILIPPNENALDVVDGRLDEPAFWKPGYFKLFISHLATFKVTASALKNTLEQYGISGFVAHEDIEPTLEWQKEIESGLFTMDALCAILIRGFNRSKWTDQEVGVALGRNVLILPIIRGLNPYGFIGKYQGFKAQGKNVGQVARGIFELLATNPKTSSTIVTRLSELFLLSNSASEALKRIKSLRLIQSLSKERVEALRSRITENDVLKSTRVLIEFNLLLQLYSIPKLKSTDFEKTVSNQTDDLPF
ncbi:MAG: toll/interleukin-1 receptor domain-containing protein [Flavobacterium sp.]|nr:MAG: toll/interleukin-1 receptor domain-containing protein [Flavobacterium sp.]